jgi:hypothetical protein
MQIPDSRKMGPTGGLVVNQTHDLHPDVAQFILKLQDDLAQAREGLRLAKECMPTHHYECEDAFYSCPSAIWYCGDDDESDCDCRYKKVEKWQAHPAVIAAKPVERK